MDGWMDGGICFGFSFYSLIQFRLIGKRKAVEVFVRGYRKLSSWIYLRYGAGRGRGLNCGDLRNRNGKDDKIMVPSIYLADLAESINTIGQRDEENSVGVNLQALDGLLPDENIYSALQVL